MPPRKPQKNKVKAAAGRLGGLATVANHGRDHMRKIGKAGNAAMRERFRFTVYGTTQYAMIERATGKIYKVIGREPNMEEILND